MESANLHHQHHQLQENLAIGSSSLAIPSCYGVPTNHAWTPTTNLSSSTITAADNASNSSFDEVHISNLRDSRQKSSDEVLALSTNTSSMVPAAADNHHLGFHHWPPTTAHDLQHLAKIKRELSSSSSSSSDICFPKLTQMLMSTSTTSLDDYHLFPSSTSTSSCGLINNIKNEQKDHQLMNDLTEKLLLRTLSSSAHHHHHQISAGDHQFYSNHHCNDQLGGHRHVAAMPSRPGQFSQIYPSINISNLNHSSSSSTISSSSLNLDMNLHAMDVLANSGRFSQPNSYEGDIDTLGMYKDRQYSFGHHQQMQHSNDHRLSCGNTSTNISSCFENDQITTSSSEVKRPGSLIGPKVTQAAAPKKSRLESRNSCPPFKVRKEKLGDRIAALQQLVAPFGKTDTASVLMEAIGYIKFLQNQVETLSVPYMKSSRNKQSTTTKTMQGGVTENGNGDQTKRDLRSRGLCLVPLSCMSYVTGDVTGGGTVWPTPNFGGGGT